MNEQNLKYIANLKAQDVPWSRLMTAYGRASEFPEIFKKLARAIEACDAARGLSDARLGRRAKFKKQVRSRAKFKKWVRLRAKFYGCDKMRRGAKFRKFSAKERV